MARFLVTYHAGDMPHDPQAMAQVRHALIHWAQNAGPALADFGSPIRSATTISSNGAHDGARTAKSVWLTCSTAAAS